MTIKVCIDSLTQWLVCNVIGDFNGTFTLNPVNWGSDVLSIQPDGKIEHRPSGTNGPYEQFKVTDDFIFVNPDSSKSPNNCEFGYKYLGA